jgi:hypothetical protein
MAGSDGIVSSQGKKGMNPHLSFLALVSFIAAFLAARTFTTFFPNTVLVGGGLHIHHFWFGLAMLAIGGWLGISYERERVDRIAAILFGAGGGLIGDEVGLLLTFGDYWSGLTYTVVIAFLASAIVMILLARYRKIIISDLQPLLKGHRVLYLGVFLAGLSAPFIMETDNAAVITTSGILAITACIFVAAYFIWRRSLRRQKKK